MSMFTLPTKAIGWLRCSRPASHEQHSINLRTYYATGTFCGYFCGVKSWQWQNGMTKPTQGKNHWSFLYTFTSMFTLAVFTLEDEQIVWTDKSPGFCPCDVNLCRTVVELFVSSGKSSGKKRFFRRPNIRRKMCSSRLHIHLFVWDDLSVQTISSFSSVKTAIADMSLLSLV